MHHVPNSPTMYWNNGSRHFSLSESTLKKKRVTAGEVDTWGKELGKCTHQWTTNDEKKNSHRLPSIGECISKVLFLTLKNFILDYFILCHFFSKLCGGAVSVWSVHFCAHWSQRVIVNFAGIGDGRRVVFDFNKNLVRCQNRKDVIIDHVKVIPVLCTRNHRSNIRDRELAVLFHDQTEDGI